VRGRRWTDRRYLALGLAIVLALAVIAQILNANVFSSQGDATKYGQLNVPGTQVVRLPAGSVEGILEDNLEQGLRVRPGLRLSVVPLEGGPVPRVTRDVGQQFGTASGNFSPDQTYRRVWQIDVARAGRYRVSVGGADPQSAYFLDLGHGPPAGSLSIWLWAGIAALIVGAIWGLGNVVERRRG
jgi:hypothetical protein